MKQWSYREEYKHLVSELKKAGFLIHAMWDTASYGDDGYPEILYAPFSGDEFEYVSGADQGVIRVNKDGITSRLFLIFGNSPGELVADYTVHDGRGRPDLEKFDHDLDAVISDCSEYWEGNNV